VATPVVIRIPVGGGIGAVEHHSESNEAYFAHTAGLRVVYCANPEDAYWMLREAVCGPDPVIFYEPKRLYWTKDEVRQDPGAGSTGRSNRARIVREGTDVTLVCYGGMVHTCIEAAEAAAEDGVEIEVIDLRSISPLDLEAVTASVKRTGRCVVTHEAPTFGGFGAEIGTAVTEACFYRLEAPVLRVGGFNTPYPAAKYEEDYLPDINRVLDTVQRALSW
jgi:pyruvate dehydrogenase E1 component beta subunit